MFKTGTTYYTRSVCDHNCIFWVKVLKRTSKTIQADCNGKVKTLRIREYKDVEYVMPQGRYSMAPIVSADKELTDELSRIRS